jgi:CRP-like cAMP-binding protein
MIMASYREKLIQLRGRSEVRRLLAGVGFSGEELELLTSCGILRSYRSGEHLTRIGSHRRMLLILISGSVRGSRVDGDSSVVEVTPGGFEVIGELSMFGDRHYQVADVVALGDVTAIAVPFPFRDRLIASAPLVMQKVEAARAPRRRSLEESTARTRAKAYEGYLAFKEALDRRDATRNPS